MRKQSLAFKYHALTRVKSQRGVTLIIGLILIVLLTLIVLNAFTLSSTNLKAVGNMQMRDEGIAAANQAIEQVISSSFTDLPSAQPFDVDINNDGTPDYAVVIAAPTCTRAMVAASGYPSDVELDPSMSSQTVWNTEWDINATVTDAASGASVHVRQGVRVMLPDPQKTAVCL